MALKTDSLKLEQGWTLFWVVFVLALGLRMVLLGQHAFHMDEAAIASWSRRILHGDLLLTGGLRNDKPPLQMYLGAIGLGLFGESESAIRLMNAALSAAECGLLAWALVPFSGGAAALGAGMLLACSPLHRGYGATGIMDGPLSFFLLLSFVLAVRGRLFASGGAWALALASKQTAILLPWPVLALAFSGVGLRQAVKDWVRGAAWVGVPLLLWICFLSNPRLGAIVGMASNQPEVGPHFAGLGARIQHWLQFSADATPWPALSPWAILAGPFISVWLWWRARDAQARAWALVPSFPLSALLVFSVLNMRFFERYALPYLAPLCATPALLAAAWPFASRGRRVFAGLSLGLGLAALLFARTQTLALDQQGAAGDRYDGYRALLLDAKAFEPQGAVIVSSQGGLRHMASWYLNPAWTVVESPEPLPQDARPVYAAEREGSAPPQGWTWQILKRYADQGPAPYWVLLRRGPHE